MKALPIGRLKAEVAGTIRVDEPLSAHTTIQVGGPADLWIAPADRAALEKALEILREARVPVLVLGKGSNVIVRDGGVRGAVLRLKNCANSIEAIERPLEAVRVRVGAGTSLGRLIGWAQEGGWAGVEILSGIPASVGGAIAMNAGTREGEIGPRVEEIEVINERGNLQRLSGEKLRWSYRHLDLPHRAVVVSAVLRLDRDDPVRIALRRDRVLEYRRQTQPVNLPSVGSVFKNPSKEKAGALIEEAGLKGVRLRQAMISDRHANWIVNLGGASSSDVIALIQTIQEKVKEKSGVKLELEAKIVGEG